MFALISKTVIFFNTILKASFPHSKMKTDPSTLPKYIEISKGLRTNDSSCYKVKKIWGKTPDTLPPVIRIVGGIRMNKPT